MKDDEFEFIRTQAITVINSLPSEVTENSYALDVLVFALMASVTAMSPDAAAFDSLLAKVTEQMNITRAAFMDAHNRLTGSEVMHGTH